MDANATDRQTISLKERLTEKKTILSFIVAFAILYLLFSQIDFIKTTNIIKTVNPILYLTAFVIFYIGFPIRGVRWRKLLNNIGFSENNKNLTEILFLSWFANCLVPAKLGDVYRGYLLKKNYRISLSKTLGTIFVERTYDVVALVALLCISSALIFGANMPGEIVFSLWIGCGLVIALILVLLSLKYKMELMVKLLPSRIGSVIMMFKEGAYGSVRKAMPIILSYTLIIWFLECGRLLLVTSAIGLKIALPIIVFVALAAALLTALPITPAGLGAVELAIAGVLMIVGIDKNLAVSVAILDRLISYWSLLIVGGLAYFITDKRR